MVKKNIKNEEPEADAVNIILQFDGEEAERFNDYKRRSYITTNAQAARKLIFDRLDELKKSEKAA